MGGHRRRAEPTLQGKEHDSHGDLSRNASTVITITTGAATATCITEGCGTFGFETQIYLKTHFGFMNAISD